MPSTELPVSVEAVKSRRILLVAALFAPIALVIRPGLHLSGESPEGPKAHSIPSTIEIESRILTPGMAMKGLFGSWSEDRGLSRWVMPPMERDPSRLDFRSPMKSQYVETTVVARDVATRGNVVLVLATLPEGDSYECRICAPLISVAWFQQSDKLWKLKNHTFLQPMGSYATPPAVSIIEIGKSNRAFELTTSDLAQGISTTSVHWLAPIPENGYGIIFDYVSSRANDGQCSPPEFPCEHVSRKVRTLASKKDYYDLEMTVRESTTAHSELKTRKVRFLFPGKRYWRSAGR
ncbi:MAG: hypothetical protein KDK23_11170 [Leptospiraceae bacterium]|nr:hypothetical protein [Leptospiraceae bacterium]